MKTSTDIKLPKTCGPIFPDKCIVCLSKPNSSTKVFKSATNAWVSFIFPIAQLFDWERFQVPICRSCKFRFHFQDWGREIGLWIYFIIIFIWLFPWFRGLSSLETFLMVCSVALVAVIPYVFLNHFWPKFLDFEFEDDAIVYEFASRVYAFEFHKSNVETDNSNHDDSSFWDYLRNPELMPELPDIRKKISDEVDSIKNAPDEIAKLVDSYIFENDPSINGWQNKQVLIKLDALTHPRALEILGNQYLHEKLLVVEGDDKSRAPICRICELLEIDSPAPIEASKLLSPFISTENIEIRKSIARIIATICAEEDMGLLSKLIKDQDENVRILVYSGLLKAIKGNRITFNMAEIFFDLIVLMWTSKSSYLENEKIPEILLGFNREKGLKFLLSENIFTLKYEPLRNVLGVFNKLSIKIPRDKLLKLISDIEKEVLEYPLNDLLSEALTLLGTYQEEDDLHLLEIYLEHSDERIVDGAIAGLYKYHQFYEKFRYHREALSQFGWDGITTAERYLCAFDLLKGEVSNGGFAQYYFNSSGDQWKTALSGLHALQASEHYKIMEETIGKFPNNNPNLHRVNRFTQLSKIVSKKEDPFADQDKAWYALSNRKLNLQIYKYNLANTKDRQLI